MEIELTLPPLLSTQPLRSPGSPRPVIVIIPSPLIAAATYESLARQLRSLGDVFVVGLPGTGAKPSVKREWTAVEYARFVLIYLNERSIDKAVLIGHSSSGPIAAEVARIAATRVEALVLADSIGIRKQPSMQTYSARCIDALLEPWLTLRTLPHFIWNFFAHSRNHFHHLRMFHKHFKVMNHLSELGVRTMLAWGQNDHAMPVQLARQLHLAGHGDLYVSPTGSHDWLLTKPVEFTLALSKWLDEN